MSKKETTVIRTSLAGSQGAHTNGQVTMFTKWDTYAKRKKDERKWKVKKNRNNIIFLLLLDIKFWNIIVSTHSLTSYHLRWLEYKFKPNSILKPSSKNENCSSIIYSNLVLFLINMALKFFPTELSSKKSSFN